MHRGKRVVAWIPYGREVTVSILIKYLVMDKVIDEIWLCMNTDEHQAEDRAFAEELEQRHPKVTRKVCPGPDTPDLAMPDEWRDSYHGNNDLDPKQLNTGRFPLYMQDRNSVYLRFDDDIVWVHEDTPRVLADRVLDRRNDVLGVFALIYNNAVSSWLLQQHGRIPREWGLVGAGKEPHQVSAVDPVGWGDPENESVNSGAIRFAINLHHMVLERLEKGYDDELQLPAEYELGKRQQYSVSTFGISGEEYEVLGGVIDWPEEEHWLTMHRTGLIGKPNVVCGMAPVAHFTFLTQRKAIMKTDILERYVQLADDRWREWRLGHNYYDHLGS